jgi:hypothetical protein
VLTDELVGIVGSQHLPIPYLYPVPGQSLVSLLTEPDRSSPAIRIYCERSSSRLDHCLRFIFHRVLQAEYLLVSDRGQSVEICYSETPSGNSVHIRPDGLLYETGLRAATNRYPAFTDHAALLNSESSLSVFPFDLFSAVFYCISRYEEWLRFAPDAHGRYEPSAATLLAGDRVLVPWADRWIAALRKSLKRSFPQLSLKDPQLQLLATIDVDNLYAYKRKGVLRTLGGALKDVVRGDLNGLKERITVLSGRKRDPFDIYEEVSEWCSVQGIPLVCFFLYGGRTRHDRTIRPSRKAYGDAFRSVLSAGASLGIHPSYDSCEHGEMISDETTRLAAHCGRQVLFSRQHYLRFDIRTTPALLRKAGIRIDFTMGFASEPGFRAGTAYPFHYYDFGNECGGELLLVPFCAMDGAYTVYQNRSPDESLRSLLALRKSVEATGGWFVTVFHERTFSERHYPGFSEIFRKVYNIET